MCVLCVRVKTTLLFELRWVKTCACCRMSYAAISDGVDEATQQRQNRENGLLPPWMLSDLNA